MTPVYQYHLCDVLTDRPFNGHPLTVFPNAGGLSTDHMRSIAREFNSYKTAFVSSPETRSGTHRLRTFSRTTELPVDYDACIGTALVLAWMGDVPPFDGDELQFVFENGAFSLEVLLPTHRDDYATVQVAAGHLPEPGPKAPPKHVIADALSLNRCDLANGSYSPQMLHCGFPCLYVPLRSLDAVSRAERQSPEWNEFVENCGARCICVFTQETDSEEVDIYCRVLTPSVGLAEVPATGCAAIGLAVLLAEREHRDAAAVSWQLEQVFEIERTGRLTVDIVKRLGSVSHIRIGGTAAYIGRGEINVTGNTGLSNRALGSACNIAREGALAMP